MKRLKMHRSEGLSGQRGPWAGGRDRRLRFPKAEDIHSLRKEEGWEGNWKYRDILGGSQWVLEPRLPAPASTWEQVVTSLPSFALSVYSQSGGSYTPEKSEMLPFKTPFFFSQESVVKHLLALHWVKGRIFSFLGKEKVRLLFKNIWMIRGENAFVGLRSVDKICNSCLVNAQGVINRWTKSLPSEKEAPAADKQHKL